MLYICFINGGFMTTSNMNLRIDSSLRDKATEVFASYGLSPAQAIKLFFTQVVKTHSVPLDFNYNSSKPTEKLATAINELETGDVDSYANLEEFIKAVR